MIHKCKSKKRKKDINDRGNLIECCAKCGYVFREFIYVNDGGNKI